VSLDIEVGELAEHMGYHEGYVVNVLNGFTEARPAYGATSARRSVPGQLRDALAAYPRPGAASAIQLHGKRLRPFPRILPFTCETLSRFFYARSILRPLLTGPASNADHERS